MTGLSFSTEKESCCLNQKQFFLWLFFCNMAVFILYANSWLRPIAAVGSVTFWFSISPSCWLPQQEVWRMHLRALAGSKLRGIGVPTLGSSLRRISKLRYPNWVDARYWKPIIVFPLILNPTWVCPITPYFSTMHTQLLNRVSTSYAESHINIRQSDTWHAIVCYLNGSVIWMLGRIPIVFDLSSTGKFEW